MSLDPETLSRLLHDLTPQPSLVVTVDDVAARVRHRRRTRTAATIAAICLLVIAAVTAPLAVGRSAGSNNGGPAPAGQPSAPKTCDVRAMKVSLTWTKPSASTLTGTLLVTNRQDRVCVLTDRPMLTPLDEAGQPLEAEQVTPGPTGPPAVSVSAGASAMSMVSWTNWCNGPVPSNRVRISWPAGGHRVVSATGAHPTSSCLQQAASPAGYLSSNWFASLVPAPDRAVSVSTNETYFNAQVTMQPPTRPASEVPVSPRDALALATGLGYVGGGTVTVEYGLFSDNTQGTYDPATLRRTGTLKMTKLFYQRVPVYLVIMRTPYLSMERSAGPAPGIVITGIEAANGKRLGVYEQGTNPTGGAPAHGGCSWTLRNNGTMVTMSQGGTRITVHVGDHLHLVRGSGCTNQPVLRTNGGTATFTVNSDTTLTVDTPGTAELKVALVGCNSQGDPPLPCFGPVVSLATINASVIE